MRYLGYAIGTGNLEFGALYYNAVKLQKRLFTAVKVATSVENRVLILNSIILPSILFTAAVFDTPEWARKDIHNLYQHFMGARATFTEAGRHKVNPGLLFTPKQAGRIGLASFKVAIKTQ